MPIRFSPIAPLSPPLGAAIYCAGKPACFAAPWQGWSAAIDSGLSGGAMIFVGNAASTVARRRGSDGGAWRWVPRQWRGISGSAILAQDWGQSCD
jgi:hypothetical protein